MEIKLFSFSFHKNLRMNFFELCWSVILSLTDNAASEAVYLKTIEKHESNIKVHMARLLAIDSYYSPITLPPFLLPPPKSKGQTSVLSRLSAANKSTDDPQVVLDVVTEWRTAIGQIIRHLEKIVEMREMLENLGTKTDTRADAAKYKTQVK